MRLPCFSSWRTTSQKMQRSRSRNHSLAELSSYLTRRGTKTVAVIWECAWDHSSPASGPWFLNTATYLNADPSSSRRCARPIPRGRARSLRRLVAINVCRGAEFPLLLRGRRWLPSCRTCLRRRGLGHPRCDTRGRDAPERAPARDLRRARSEWTAVSRWFQDRKGKVARNRRTILVDLPLPSFG